MVRKPPSIFYWEAKRRVELLTAYRQLVNDYYSQVEWSPLADWEDTEESSKTRQAINEGMYVVRVAINFVGITTVMYYAPLPGMGGVATDMALLDNVFNLPRFQIPHTKLLDDLDRATGIYREWLRPLWWKLFNPFYWMGWLLYWIASIPFRLLDAAGFDGTKIEESLAGRIVRATIQIVVTAAAVVRAVISVFF